MTHKEKEKCREEIGNTIVKWLHTLHLVGWSVYVLLPDHKQWEKPAEDGFSIRVEYPYKRIVLNVSEHELNNYREIPKENREASLLHEALHVLLWDFVNLAEQRYVTQEQLSDTEERLVDSLKSIILDLKPL